MEFKVKTVLVFLLLSAVLFSGYSLAAQTVHFEREAEILKDLGLFKGTNLGFELERPPTRLEALVMLIRLLGLEESALSSDLNLPFNDVPAWGKNYVAYAYEKGLTLGYSKDTFGSQDAVSEAQFLTFVLRSLGYNDSLGDFRWADSALKGEEIGLLTEAYKNTDRVSFLRDHCVSLSYQSLLTPLKGTEQLLLQKLSEAGSVDKDKALGLLDLSALYASQAAQAFQKRQTAKAIELYEKAIALRPEKADLYSSIAEVYRWMSTTAATDKDKILWRDKLEGALKDALNFDPENLEYNKALLLHLFDLELWEEALAQAESFYHLSADKKEAARYLAQGYCDLGISNLIEGKLEEGKELLNQATNLLNNFSLSADNYLQFYGGKAHLALKNFDAAEALIKEARANKNLTYDCDRLLYLINEKTGRVLDNKKYDGVMWMGLVKSSTIYLKMKQAVENNIS